MGREEGSGGKEKERGTDVKPRKTAKNRNFYRIFIFGAPVPTPQPQSGPHLARKCRPMVHSFMPNFHHDQHI